MGASLFLFAFIGFASGILCRSLFVFSPPLLLLPMIVGSASLALFCVRRHRAQLAAALFFLAAVAGAARTMLASETLPEAFMPLLESEVVFEGIIVAEPDIRETTQRIRLEVVHEGETTNVLVVAPRYPETGYGDVIRAKGTLALPEPFATDGGRKFRYDRFLAKDGVFALVEFARVEVLAPPESLRERGMAALLSLKHAFQDGLAAALPEPGASLASGLITGGKQGLGSDLLDAFVIAGLVHIVVLSGYNVMIVAEAVLRALAWLPKRFGALAALAVITLFVLAAGAGPASIRAGLMAGLALIARATGRTYAVVRALCVVALAMLLANPLLLAHDPGFQLSFVATLGLILGAPIIAARLAFVRSEFWRELLASTLAAQLSVLPLILYQTGLLSLVSLPANLAVLPVVPLAMLLSAAAGAFGMAFSSFAPFIGLPAHTLLVYIIEAARLSAALPLASITLPAFPFALVPLAYAGLAALYLREARRLPEPAPSALRQSSSSRS